MTDLIEFSSPQEAVSKIGGVPLDASDPWDAMVEAESRRLSAWCGVSPQVVRVSGGTAAYPCGVVTVDRAQLSNLFGGFPAHDQTTAVFFALAHEFGHLAQFSRFTVKQVLRRSRRKVVEAHADVISGIWLGHRLLDGEDHSSDAVMQAGLQLKSNSPRYPTALQRGALVQEGMSLATMMGAIVEPQISDPDYTPSRACLTPQDILDTYKVAFRRLQDLPERQ